MKLYFSAGACSLAPHIAIHELGLNCETESVNLKTKKTKSGEDFNKINAKGYVPALQIDAKNLLTEGAVIMQYLADQKPEKNLIPKAGTIERYRCQEWLNFIATEVHKNFSALFNKEAPEAIRTRTKNILSQRFDFISQQMKKDEFLMGKQFTVADAYLFTVLSWSKLLDFDMSKWPTLMGYAERIHSRPGVQVALKAEGLH